MKSSIPDGLTKADRPDRGPSRVRRAVDRVWSWQGDTKVIGRQLVKRTYEEIVIKESPHLQRLQREGRAFGHRAVRRARRASRVPHQTA